ncbi:MAG: hypothetical protein JO127_16750 [Caulobacteraceae bacterium]|nr:hypothetical protein [Caulobacteraceae bacterium]
MTGPSSADRAPAPLLVGVTGKLDLKDAEAEVREALDLAFARLDKRCPSAPKVLLSALARGADMAAAEAALARPGWRVIAPLPFSLELYLQDFGEADARRLRQVLAHPRTKTLVLPPLREHEDGRPFADAELERSDTPNRIRDEHYEQAGLFVAERAALLLAVMDAAEAPGKTGGSARIVRHRLDGELDAGAASIARRSEVLTPPARLTDRRTGPVWLVDLARLAEAHGGPASALLAWNPGDPSPAPLEEEAAFRKSLRLADSIEALNVRVGRIPPKAWAELERRSGGGEGDAASELGLIRLALSVVQGQMVRRVRQSIWLLALLSCAAIFSFEVYVDLSFYAWTRWFSVAYSALVAFAILIYGFAAGRRWQRLAEDYRAASEAIRVQLVWWASGLKSRRERVGRFYLRGAQGTLRQLRALVDHLIDAAELSLPPPAADPATAPLWVDSQIEFFERRIADRRRELAAVEGASWFLFGASLGVGACLAAMQIWLVLPAVLMGPGEWSPPIRWALLVAGAAVIGALLLVAARGRRRADREEGPPAAAVWIMGLLGGLVLTFTLCDLAAMASGASPAKPRIGATLEWAKDLIAIAVIVPAAMAGALRYVADKSSWAAELSGYEHAREQFQRGHDLLTAPSEGEALTAPERREVVLALGEEALAENEAWLRSHRERPLEPVVGG